MVILMYNTRMMKNDLKKMLSKKRYEHSLLVANEAKKLASKYGYDKKKAYVTGLIHDIAKELSKEEVDYYVAKYNISNDNPKTIHSDIGAIIAKEKYNFTEEMCKAIASHTVGNEDMSLLDKIILVADKIGRKNLSMTGREIKKLAYKNLELALLKYLEGLKEKLDKEKQEINKVTLDLIEKLKKQTSNFS